MFGTHPSGASMRRALVVLALPCAAQEADLPLALNLPTTDSLEAWQPAIRFTHRFLESARNHAKDWYGWDGGNYAGVGLDLGLGRGLNGQVYRTSDGKTVVIALQQRLLKSADFGIAVRVERFDETVQRASYSYGTVGISGAALQLPVEFTRGGFTVAVVPTWLSRSSTREGGFATAAVGLRWTFVEQHALLAEYYPRPSRLDGAKYEQGWSLGYRFATRNHRFTILGTTSNGSTAHQVLGGDYGGGPRRSGEWTFGFNLARLL